MCLQSIEDLRRLAHTKWTMTCSTRHHLQFLVLVHMVCASRLRTFDLD